MKSDFILYHIYISIDLLFISFVPTSDLLFTIHQVQTFGSFLYADVYHDVGIRMCIGPYFLKKKLVYRLKKSGRRRGKKR